MTYAILAGIATAGIYLLIALGFNLQLRVADIVNIAYGGFVVSGMYMTLFLVNSFGVPYPLAVPMAVVVGTAVSWLLWIAFLRRARELGHREQIVFSMLLLSILEVAFTLLSGPDIQSLDIQAHAMSILGVQLQVETVVGCVIAVAVCALLFAIFRFTALGKSIEVAGSYPDGAAVIGLPVQRLYTLVYLSGNAMAFLAGALIVATSPVTPFLGFQYVVLALMITLAARLSFVGCIFTALLYGIGVQVLVQQTNASTAIVLIYLILMAVMVLVPFVSSGLNRLRHRRKGQLQAGAGTEALV